MIISVDLDGVVYDFRQAIRGWIALTTGDDPGPAADSWDFHAAWGLTDDNFRELFHEGVKAGFVFAVGQPIPGAVDALEILHREHTIHIVTDRPMDGAEDNTRRWLRQHHIPHDALTFTADKCSVPADLMVEDRVENLQALAAAGVRAICYSQPWNSEWAGERVVCWGDVLDLVAA